MATLDRLETYRERYASLNQGWQAATLRYQNLAASLLVDQPRVLDLGCGRGGIVERLHEQGHWFGVDPDYASLRDHRLPSLPRAHAHAECLPFAESSFGLIISSWVLEHLAEPQYVFAEVARVLQPGGHWLFLTPNTLHPIPRVSKLLMGLRSVQTALVRSSYKREKEDTFPVQYKANTTAEISQLAAQAGLRLQQMDLVDDPSYFAYNELSFKLALVVEKLIPPQAKVHIIGHFTKPA